MKRSARDCRPPEVLKEFSIATECCFGRRPAETIPQLLRIHAEIAALP